MAIWLVLLQVGNSDFGMKEGGVFREERLRDLNSPAIAVVPTTLSLLSSRRGRSSLGGV